MQVAKNEELGLELVTLLNTKEKLQNDKEAAELETMQVIINTTQQNLLFSCAFEICPSISTFVYIKIVVRLTTYKL